MGTAVGGSRVGRSVVVSYPERYSIFTIIEGAVGVRSSRLRNLVERELLADVGPVDIRGFTRRLFDAFAFAFAFCPRVQRAACLRRIATDVHRPRSARRYGGDVTQGRVLRLARVRTMLIDLDSKLPVSPVHSRPLPFAITSSEGLCGQSGHVGLWLVVSLVHRNALFPRGEHATSAACHALISHYCADGATARRTLYLSPLSLGKGINRRKLGANAPRINWQFKVSVNRPLAR